MTELSPLAILNEISKRSSVKCFIEILTENPCECKISFQSHATFGRARSNREALQKAAEEMLKLIHDDKLNLYQDYRSISPSAETLKNVNNLKQYCFSKGIAEPSFEVLKGSVTMKNNTTVIVKCHFQDASYFGIGENDDKAFDRAASFMLDHLKLRSSISNDDEYNTNELNNRPPPSNSSTNNNHEIADVTRKLYSVSTVIDQTTPKSYHDGYDSNNENELNNRPPPSSSSTNDHEIAEVTRRYYSNSNDIGHTTPRSQPFPVTLSLANQHLAGTLDTFFTRNEKMLELKATPIALLLSCPDPLTLVKDICAAENVQICVSELPSTDGSCCATLQIHTNEMWTMISDGKNFDEARNDASRKMLLFFKNMMV